MIKSISINQKDNNNIQNYNEISADSDNSSQQEPIKAQKNKVYEQIPLEENIEQYEISEENKFSKIHFLLKILDSFDKKISKPLQIYEPSYPIELIFFVFSKICNFEPMIFYLLSILFYYLIKEKTIYPFVLGCLYVLPSALICMILKKIIGRERPKLEVKRYFKLVREKEKHKSMPSGDSLQAGVFSTLAILYFNNNLKYFSILLVPAVISGRVFYSCHYFFDCIIGSLLGVIITMITYFCVNNHILFKI